MLGRKGEQSMSEHQQSQLQRIGQEYLEKYVVGNMQFSPPLRVTDKRK